MNRYRRCALTMAAVLLLACFPLWAGASLAPDSLPAGEAENLTPLCGLDITHNPQEAYVIMDQNRSTRFYLEAGAQLRIKCETPISQLYIVWDQPPGQWSYLTEEGDGGLYGRHDFIHEYVELSSPTGAVTITMGDEPAILCDIYVFGEGQAPAWVQRWQSPYEQADMLLFPTHADDEHLFFGGTMPYYAGQLERKVQVVYITNHWGEYYRPHELLSGLWEVGVTAYPVMGPFPDMFSDTLATADSQYGRENVTLFLVEMLRRFKPFVVVGHDLNGEYGHGVHMLGAHALLDAAALSNEPEYAPALTQQYDVWDVPKVYLHLYPENEILMDWDMHLDRFGKTAYEAAVAGFAHHISQQAYFQVEHWGPYDCRKFGLAHTRVGPDFAGDDMFENIVLPSMIEPEPEPVPEPSPPPEPSPQQSPEPEPSPPPESRPALSEFSLSSTAISYILIGVAGVLVLISAILLFANKRKK